MHEIYRMWHKPFIRAVATILTVWSSALASSWHKASVRPPWVPPLAPRWRHLDGHGEHSKLLGFEMSESQHFCKNVYIRILKYIAQIGPSQMSKLQVTAFNMYANHGGGYIYMLCKRTEFLQCRTDHLSEPIRSSTREQQDAYLKCLDFPRFFEVFVDQAMWFVFMADFPTIQCVQVFDCFQCLFFHSLLNLNLDTVVASRCIWDCFESHVLDFADSQWLEYQEQKDMNATWSSTVKLGGQIQSSMCLWWESSHHGQLPKHEVIVCHFQIVTSKQSQVPSDPSVSVRSLWSPVIAKDYHHSPRGVGSLSQTPRKSPEAPAFVVSSVGETPKLLWLKFFHRTTDICHFQVCPRSLTFLLDFQDPKPTHKHLNHMYIV